VPIIAESRTPGKTIEHALNIFGKYVEALRRHDHFFFPAEDRQLAVFLECTNVAGMEPAAFESLAVFRRSLIASSDVRAADQDLAIVTDLHFDSANGLLPFLYARGTGGST